MRSKNENLSSLLNPIADEGLSISKTKGVI